MCFQEQGWETQSKLPWLAWTIDVQFTSRWNYLYNMIFLVHLTDQTVMLSKFFMTPGEISIKMMELYLFSQQGISKKS